MLRSSSYSWAILLPFFLSITTVLAQKSNADKANYTLLWEISGNGLAKPSYLFGTMHLRDKRVFDFPDSLLTVLDNCDAFASEVRMDSMVYYSWELSESGDTSNRLAQNMSPMAYARLLEALKSKGLRLDDLDSKNEEFIKNALSDREEPETDESKKLFLDLYLTRLAYLQGKTLHALEKPEEYKDLNNAFFRQFEDPDFAKKDTSYVQAFSRLLSLQNMISAYQSGNLSLIEAISNDTTVYNDRAYRREMLDNRNMRMVKKMEDIMAQQSVFCAVGAAHLPDSMGMLQLLKEKGYQVRPLTADFTGKAAQYTEKKVAKEWYQLKDDFYHFDLKFPGQPYLMNKMNTNRRRLGMRYMFYDLNNGAISLAEADYYPYLGSKEPFEKVLNKLFKNWAAQRSHSNLEKEVFQYGDLTGIKFKGTLKSKLPFEGRFFLANNTVYTLTIIYNKNNLDTTNTEEFFNSFKITPLPLTDWQVYEDKKGAFSVKMPTKPDIQTIPLKVPVDENTNVNYYSHVYMSKDLKEGFSYMLRYSDIPNGRSIDNDSTFLSETVNEGMQRLKNMGGKLELDSTTKHYGYREFNFKWSFKEGTILARAILRGNRLYYLVAQPPASSNKGTENKLRDWLNSFRLEPLETPELKPTPIPEWEISVALPSSIEPYAYRVDPDNYPSLEEGVVAVTHDKTAISFLLTRTTYSKYFDNTDADSLVNGYAQNFVDVDTNLLKIKVIDTTFNNHKGKYCILKRNATLNDMHFFFFEKNGYLFEGAVVLPYEMTDLSVVYAFFKSINIPKTASNQASVPKKELILKDIASDIDAVNEEANSALKGTIWTKEDLPRLHDALKKSYNNDTLEYASTRLQLLQVLENIKDVSSIPVIEKLGQDATIHANVQEELLCSLLRFDTLGSADTFFKLAKAYNKDKEELAFYCVQKFMSDSLQRALSYYDKMLALYDKPFENQWVVHTTNLLLQKDSSKILVPNLKKYTPQYLDAANALFDRSPYLQQDSVKDFTEDFYTVDNYVELLSKLPQTTGTTAFFQKTVKSKNKALLSAAIRALASTQQNISLSNWQELLKDKYWWFNTLQSLDSDSLLSVVPAQLIQQKDIAEGYAQQMLYYDDYGDVKEVKLLETRKHKGETLYIYLFTFEYDGVEENLIALCSQPSDKTKFSLKPTIFRYSEALEDVKGYKKVVETLLKEE